MDRALLAEFADLFAYPGNVGDVAGHARRALALTGDPALHRFADWARTASGEIEEVYCATFDLNPVCDPYLGDHLCPERRGLFLAALLELYEQQGFRTGGELGDHLAEVLRFTSATKDETARSELLRDAVLPALQKMAPLLEGNPYRPLVDALQAHLARRQEARP